MIEAVGLLRVLFKLKYDTLQQKKLKQFGKNNNICNIKDAFQSYRYLFQFS